MSNNPGNAVMAMGEIYAALSPAKDPVDLLTKSFGAASSDAAWQHVGGLRESLAFNYSTKYGQLTYSNQFAPIGNVPLPNDRGAYLSFTHGEVTAEIFRKLLNLSKDLIQPAVDDSEAPIPGLSTLEEPSYADRLKPSYLAVFAVGVTNGGDKLAFLLRKALNTASIQATLDQSNQTGLAVEMEAQYISESVKAWKIWAPTGLAIPDADTVPAG